MSDNCQVVQSNKLLNQFRLWFTEVFKHDNIFRTALTMRNTFMDTNIETIKEILNDIPEVFTKEFDDKSFFKEIQWIAERNLAERAKVWEITDNVVNKKDIKWLRTMLRQVSILQPEWLRDKAWKLIDKIESTMWKWKYDIDLIFSRIKDKRDLQNMIQSFNGSLKNELVTMKWTNNIRELLETEAKQLMPESASKDFVKAVLSDPLWSWRVFNWIQNLKSMYRFLKYSPWPWTLWGTILLIGNSIIWAVKYLSLKRWLWNLIKSDWVEELITKYNLMKSDDRAMSMALTLSDQEWKNRLNKWLNWFLNKVPLMWERWREDVKAILKWWIHQTFDLLAESSVKRLSIAQSLSKYWLNEYNLPLFMKKLDAWDINANKLLNQIRTDASLYNSDFFWNASLTALSRHRFSKYRLINTLQWYVTHQSDTVVQSVSRFWRDRKNWKFKTYWQFIDYLNTENQELKWIINNVLASMKLAYLVDYTLNWDEADENKHRNYLQYMVWTSDYLSSISSTFFYRWLTSPLRWTHAYMDYSTLTWKWANLIDWVNTVAFSTLAEILRSMFREGAVLKTVKDWAMAFLETWDVDFTQMVIWKDTDSISNWLWRFMLLPWMDTYDLSYIPQQDDFFSRMVLTFQETNESLIKANKIKDISQVDQMLNDKRGYLNRMVEYLPVIWMLMKKNTYAEAKYQGIVDMIDKDPVMKKIWNWQFPTEVLQYDTVVNHLSADLFTFDYRFKQYKGKWEHEETYGLSDTKESVFVKNIAEKVFGSVEAMNKALLQSTGWKQLWMTKILAAAEAQEPWSSRIVLSYLASAEQYRLKQQVTGKSYPSAADVTIEDENNINRYIISKYYPYLSIADKDSRYKVAREYLSASSPSIYWTLASDSEIKWMVNTMAFTDMLMRQQAATWDVDAKYIKNIFNIANKYVQTPSARVSLVSNTLATIGWLSNANNEQKNMMRMWVLAGNIDFYDKLKQDPVTAAAYAPELRQFERMVRWNLDWLNNIWADSTIKEMSNEAKQQYYSSKWKYYTPSRYSSWNYQTADWLKQAASKYYDPSTSYATWKQYPYQPIQYPYTAKYDWATPNEVKFYMKVTQQYGKTDAENIVQGYNKKYPWELITNVKFKTWWPGKQITAMKPKFIGRAKKAKTYTNVNRNLPGG